MINNMDEIKLQVGVKVFLQNDQGNFLFLKRNPYKYKNVKGDWDIVGGRINPGTTLLENLKREVLEETGLEIIGDVKIVLAQDIIPSQSKHVVRISYIGKTNGDPILDKDENIEYKWIPLEDAKKMENLDIYVKEILDKKLI